MAKKRTTAPAVVRAFLAEAGRKGGLARGPTKARSNAAEAARIRWERYRAKKAKREAST